MRIVQRGIKIHRPRRKQGAQLVVPVCTDGITVQIGKSAGNLLAVRVEAEQQAGRLQREDTRGDGVLFRVRKIFQHGNRAVPVDRGARRVFGHFEYSRKNGVKHRAVLRFKIAASLYFAGNKVAVDFAVKEFDDFFHPVGACQHGVYGGVVGQGQKQLVFSIAFFGIGGF